MKIAVGYPPNISKIREVLGEKPGTIYCYGDIIFNPSGKDIPPDILFHEQVHQNRQKEFLSPDLWWQKYLGDRDFRQDQETEAYAIQYKMIQENIRSRGHKEALFELAYNLSSVYNLGISYQQAESLIRNRVKSL